MSSAGSLVIISCSEPNPLIDPARFFNLTTNTTQVVKTAGGRTEPAISNIYHIDQSSKIGMVIVIQHTGCAWSPGVVDANICADIQALRNSQWVRNEITMIGYVLDTATSQLREVCVPHNGADSAARQQVLSQMGGFGPFWG